MRTPEKRSDVGAFAFPRTTKPRRYDYGGAATFPFGGYRPGLRSVVGARYCPPGGPRRGRAGDHRGEAERQAQRGAVAWSPEVITALADALVGVGGVLSERVARMVGFLICVPSKLSLVLEVLGTDEASLKDDID